MNGLVRISPEAGQSKLQQWRIKDFDVGGGIAAGAQHGEDTAGWIDAQAPGDVYVALLAAGRCGDPFHARHEHDVSWVQHREWWWCTEFEVSAARAGERIELVFEGLDTFAEIYLDGESIGCSNNMFRSWRFDVGAKLRAPGTHHLAVAFAPATQSVAESRALSWPVNGDKISASKRNLMRKAQFGWGWDWGPNLPTVGIWKDVRIERSVTARIADLACTTLTLNARHAELKIDIAIEREDAAAGLSAELTLRDPDGAIVSAQTVAIETQATLELAVEKPRLWWTADLGAQPLYALSLRLLAGGQLLDTQQRRIGIRTITLDTADDPDEPGTQFFRFVLNGVPIFARGACWIPAKSFVAEIEDARYRDLLAQAVTANMNMMRVWGGGIYEHDVFYELCDQLGLLVWQDFMFACAPYPDDDPAFVDNVRHEVRQQVQRLRSHPSLALWCGNNECQVLQDVMNQMSGGTTAVPGTLFYDQLIPEVLAQLDPATPYWPGSPAGGPSPNSMRAGDVHNWTVWHGVPPVPDDKLVGEFDRSPAGVAYTRYGEDMGRFISEFGIHSAPGMATLQRWLPTDALTLDSAGFLDRIKDEPKDKVNAMLVSVTGLPATLTEYIDFTMITQAEGLKFGIEHFRRRMPHCSGTLIWQYNDCWPCVSWSLVDYDGVGKASLYATARAYAPVLASFKSLDDGAVELWISNDSPRAVTGEALIELIRFAGGVDWCAAQRFDVPARTSAAIWRGTVPAVTDRVLCVHTDTAAFAPNRHLLAPVRDLALTPDAIPRVTITQIDAQSLQVDLYADTYLLFVHLTSSAAGARFSDNYFDLRAGEQRTVLVHGMPGTAQAADAISIRCWNSRLTAEADDRRVVI